MRFPSVSRQRLLLLGVPALVFSCLDSLRAATFYLSQQTDVMVPTGRGSSNTTYYGWDSFNELTFRDLPNAINDATPELGSNPGAALIVTNNAQDHISNASGNYYSGTGRVDETITADAAGVIGSGFTTIVAQGITAFGDFGAAPQFSSINGVAPTVVYGVDNFGGGGANGKGQFWALWALAGNQDSYQFMMTTDPAANGGGGSFFSIDKLIIDTLWTPGAPVNDVVFSAPVPEPVLPALLGLSLSLVAARRRRSAHAG